MKLEKIFFISLQKLFSFSRRPKFRTLDIQFHDVIKCLMKKFYWITWEENSLLMKFGQYISYYKRNNFIKKFYKTTTWKLVPGPFVFAKN